MDMISQRDLLSMTLAAAASAFASITAGGAGDNTPVVGLTLDRYGFGVPLTAVFDVAVQATMAAGNTLTLKAVTVFHSTDGVTFSPYATPADPGIVLTGPAGGGTVQAVARIGVPLREAARFLRLVFTPDLSAANTDTAQIVAVATFGGFDQLPPVLGSPA